MTSEVEKSSIELRVLGPVELLKPEGKSAESVLDRPRLIALLTYLAIEAHTLLLRRKDIASFFWPETNEERAHGSLRNAIFEIRKELGEDIFLGKRSDRLGINSKRLMCDVHQFDAAIEQESWERAADLYRGDFATGLFLRGNVDFDQWADQERNRLEKQCVVALSHLAHAAFENKEYGVAVEWTRRMANQDPHKTRFALQHMEALALADQRAAAIKHADRFAKRLLRDLNATVASAVRQYADQLRRDPDNLKAPESSAFHSSRPSKFLDRLQAALSDRYNLEHEIGWGGMSRVFLAEDRQLGRRVAVKALRCELAETVAKHRFQQEIASTAKLLHSCIVPLHDSGTEGGLIYYIMPYYKDGTVASLLADEKALPLKEIIGMAYDVACGLDFAHKHDIIHRDIKPANILLGPGHALVADFGIAGALTVGGTGLTATGEVVGTPGYMSPEQASGDELDGRSDQYSLACVVFELLTCHRPYEGATEDLLVKQLTGPPPSVLQWDASLPESIDHTLKRALACTPVDRFDSNTEFVSALATQARAN